MRIKINLFLFLFFSCFASLSLATPKGMVVSENKIASQVGAQILRSGGNAIDAAVAVGYALAVVNSCCGNIGGGGFMTIHLANGNDIFLNFREKASLKATKDMFLDAHRNLVPSKTTKGYLAVGIPGTVLGFETALQKYGSMTRQQVITPAIQLAEKGYIVSPYEAKLFAKYANDFREQPNVAAIFLKHNKSYTAGERLIQTDLANTLKQIAEKGANVFYKGDIAKEIVNASNLHGGILTLADFAKYTVKESTPIYCNYRGYTIVSAAPPSAGGVTLCEMLNILENFSLTKLGYHSTHSAYYIIEAMRYGFLDRNQKLGDPDFVKNPIKELTSKEYAKKISRTIDSTDFSTKIKINKLSNEKNNTTHYSVIDRNGNAVSVTYTINGYFGARVIAGHTGFFLNDEMDDFAAKPGTPNKFGLVQQDANDIQPEKRPLSSMTPTIVLKNGKPFIVLGSPGGPRITTAVLLTLLNVIDYDMDLQAAVNAPRFHYQVQPHLVDVEPFAFTFSTRKQLELMGYPIWTQRGEGSSVEAILIKDDKVIGASDPRKPDAAAIGE